jgi:NADP-dependent 3-hydroxy acid dehydrogenase YdfG
LELPARSAGNDSELASCLLNHTSQAYQQNTAEQKEMVDLVKQVYDDIGPVGGIVCNAGTAVSKPVLEMTREDLIASSQPMFGVCLMLTKPAHCESERFKYVARFG